MGNKFENTEGITMRVMTLFFVVDSSGSMYGTKIGAVNEAINNVIPEIQSISDDNADAQIKIAVLDFSTGAVWLTPQPVDANDFKWKYLDADGVTDLGRACEMLNEKLSRHEFMGEAAGSFAPAIFLLSDGEPTDDWEKGLEKLKGNNWFKHALKAAIAIGDDANEDVLFEFTGNKESVIKVHTPEALAKLIRFVAVTSSQIGSKSQDIGAFGISDDDLSTKQVALNDQIQDFAADLNDADDDEW